MHERAPVLGSERVPECETECETERASERVFARVPTREHTRVSERVLARVPSRVLNRTLGSLRAGLLASPLASRLAAPSRGALALVAAALLAVAVAGLAGLEGSTGARVAPPRHRIDVASASVAELALLPEVGPSLAARIAADRAVRGAFASVDELARVDGFGSARVEALREDARVGTPRGRER